MCAVPKCMHACIHTCIHPYMHTLLYITLHYITYITYIHTYVRTIPYHTIPYHTIPYHTIHTIHTYHTYMHACMHTCIHAYSSHSRVYRHIYTVGCIDIYILLFYCIYIYIYTYVCYFLLPISSSRVVRKKKTTYKLFTPERLQRHPFRHVWLEEGTPFHWFIIMFLSEKKHLQLTESVEFSWKPPYPFRSFPYFSIVGSGGGTPSFSALWSSWNLGHPRPLGGGRVLDPGNVVKRRSLLLRKNTPCSTEWIYYKYIYIYTFIISYILIYYI